ncbi:MAG: hypothetical protein K0R58_1913 [Ramlibacter sp.]|nr:hypothetical protein [Ramlibacter sp.]
MRAQRVPESIAIHIKGNPEFVPPEALVKIADEVAAAAIERLTRAHALPSKSGAD